jgi:hypothetical protein
LRQKSSDSESRSFHCRPWVHGYITLSSILCVVRWPLRGIRDLRFPATSVCRRGSSYLEQKNSPEIIFFQKPHKSGVRKRGRNGKKSVSLWMTSYMPGSFPFGERELKYVTRVWPIYPLTWALLDFKYKNLHLFQVLFLLQAIRCAIF